MLIYKRKITSVVLAFAFALFFFPQGNVFAAPDDGTSEATQTHAAQTSGGASQSPATQTPSVTQSPAATQAPADTQAPVILDTEDNDAYYANLDESNDTGDVDASDADIIPFDARAGIIISDEVNVRAMPDVEADPVLMLSSGTNVTIKNVIDDEWYYIEDGYDAGYIRKDFVYSPKDNTEGSVNGIDINFRAEPSTEAEVLGTLTFGEKLSITGFQNGWFSVKAGDKSGYLIRSLVAVKGIDYVNNNAIQLGDRSSVVSTVQKQLNKMGFFDFSITGEFGAITKDAVEKFQKVAKLESDGVIGPETLELINEGKIQNPDPLSAATGSSGASIGKVEMLDWWKSGSSFFPRGTVATITDVRTGKRWKMKRTGGTNHADSEPLTANDTAIFKSVVGSWTWNRRPILVTVDGRTSAASMNAMPHAFKRLSVNNNFPGHCCIHFLNSRTHGSNKVDAAHQKCIREAYNSRRD